MFESQQSTSYGVITTLFIMTTISILLRIYSRGLVLKSFGWDDWCMFTILFFNCGQQAILYYFLSNGAGLHFAKVISEHPEWMQNLTNALFAEEMIYVWMHWAIKMAFLLFYLRFAIKLFRTLVFWTIGLNTLFTIIIWLIYCFQCIPLSAFFNPTMHPGVKCLKNSILAFVPAAFSIFTDILIVILPIQPLWAIQVSLRKRLELISIASVGAIVVIISCIRLIILIEFQKGTDFTYTLNKLIIISAIEIEVAIMCANAPSLTILWVKFVSRSADANELRGAERYREDQYVLPSNASSRTRNTKGQSYFANCSIDVPMERMPRKEAEERVDATNSNSEEQLWKHDGGIIVTSSVEVQTHVAHPLSPPLAGKGYANQFDAV
ncbi:hypothetical protein B0J14DRAFT_258505 [Halenospora varia]|nr:hypothetical protein B0J14DRAFT_258505 [Halenospora varia]